MKVSNCDSYCYDNDNDAYSKNVIVKVTLGLIYKDTGIYFYNLLEKEDITMDIQKDW